MSATEQETPRIQEWRRRFLGLTKKLDPRRLVFVDEAGSNIGMTRDYARAPRGERAPGSVPRNRGTGTTMLGALDLRGVRALMTIEGGADAEAHRPGWSKLKSALEDFGARTVDDLHRAIRRTMDPFCADDAAGWFTHRGQGAPAK